MRGTLNICVLILFGCCYFLAAAREPQCIDTVDTQYGQVKGICDESARVFKSIPYGVLVSGDNRWKEAENPPYRIGVYHATTEPPACPQICYNNYCNEQDEECLFLNIFTPRSAKGGLNLPVLVFIHGGAYIVGYSASPLFDGTYLASHFDIIVVTINYRLGALGFLVYDDIKGNFGIKDQRLALQWVKNNIYSFGGDPTQVTLSGESAGAMSVAIHMTSESSYGLFHKAIIQSDPFRLGYNTVQKAADIHRDKFVDSLGCSDLSCLRKKDLSEILDAQNDSTVDTSVFIDPKLVWAPVIDDTGDELTDQPLNLFKMGHFKHMPTIMGTTGAEGIPFVYYYFKDPVDQEKYRQYLYVMAMYDEEKYKELLKLYPEGPIGTDHRPQLSEILTDYEFYCPTDQAARSASDANSGISAPVYLYVFNHRFPVKQPNPDAVIIEAGCGNHACHAAELPYVFHTYEDRYTEDERKLADTVSEYWGNFVNTGNPNTPWPPELLWPQFTSASNIPWMTLKINLLESQVESEYRKSYCDLMDQLVKSTKAITLDHADFAKTIALSPSAGFVEAIADSRNGRDEL